jgi:hypothetical protein
MKGSEARDVRWSATFARLFRPAELAALPFSVELGGKVAHKALVLIEFQWLMGPGIDNQVVEPSLGAGQVVLGESESLAQQALKAVSFHSAPDAPPDGES